MRGRWRRVGHEIGDRVKLFSRSLSRPGNDGSISDTCLKYGPTRRDSVFMVSITPTRLTEAVWGDKLTTKFENDWV